MKTPTLYIVVPCYNEEECIPDSHNKLQDKLDALIKQQKVSTKSRLLYIDDGSKDNTWSIIKSFKKKTIGLKLAHNRGHQNALLAGLLYSKDHADITISIDADLQDDINAIDKMIDEYVKGNEIVYGVRADRRTDTAFKRGTAQGFYKFMSWLGVDLVYNSADFRLMNKRALTELSHYGETNIFLRGIIPQIGLKTSIVEYSRGERLAGESKYPLKKMLHFAWDGITSFSVKPIRMVLSFGLIIFCISILILLYAIISKILGNTVSGWTFIVCSIWILGGAQMIAIGLIGEYIGKIYSETKNRPRYFIEETFISQ